MQCVCVCVQTVDGRGVTELTGGYSKRGRYRGAPMTRDLVSALVSGSAVEAANDVLLVDLLRRCLDVNPDERITATEAIRHDWLRRRQGPSRPAMKTTPGGASTTRSSVLQQHSQFIQDTAATAAGPGPPHIVKPKR